MEADASQETSWGELFSGTEAALEAAPGFFHRLSAELDEYLDTNPNASEQLNEVILRHIRVPMTSDDYGTLWDGIQTLVGEDATFLLHWYASRTTEDERAIFQSQASPRVQQFVRKVGATYGPELNRLTSVVWWGEYVDDWKDVTREVFFDSTRERYRVNVRVQKLNGEEFAFGATPDSVLTLMRSLMGSLNRIARPEVFSEGVLEQFFGEADSLREKTQRDESSGGPDLGGAAEGAESSQVTSGN
jgi:hypothetical protein